jgi:hypothetical protein
LALFVAGLLALSVAKPDGALAGVSGQKEAWNVQFGTGPGELFDPQAFGVDPVDGSVYILSNEEGFEFVRVDKFSASGSFEGSVAISRTPDEASAEGIKGFVGIAVDHAQSRFYVVQDEKGLQTGNSEASVATKVLAFSTVPNASHQLEPAATPSFNLPAANGANTLLWPTEIQVDPSNDDLIVAAEDPAHHVVLQRITDIGVEPSRYVESGSALRSFAPSGEPTEPNFGFVVGSDGTTYIVANTGSETSIGGKIEAFTLAPEFQPSGSPVLTAIPGFTAAATSEQWETIGFGAVSWAANATGDSFGPQVALTTAPDGEETLLWKAADGQHEPNEVVRIHGYSLQQKATTTVYGGGSSKKHCSIETRTAGIAATTGGDLLVLDQGPFLEEPTNPPAFGPNVFRFGPGGSECPGPAPLARLKSGGNEVTTVQAGTSVTLDASGSELGGNTLSQLTWTIEGPGGTEPPITVDGPAPALETPHVFATEGEYTIHLSLKASASVGYVGTGFTAKPVKLMVTPGAPSVSSISPNHGPAAGNNSVEIIGTNLENATKVEFGSTQVSAPFAEDTATKIKLLAPTCTAGQAVHVKVTTANGTSTTSSNDEYTCDSPTAPTVSSISPNHGPPAGNNSVEITGTNLEGATKVEFGSTQVSTPFAEDTATKIKLLAPTCTAGQKVHVKVTASGGTSVPTAADEYTCDAPAAPTVSSISPNHGAAAGGTVVTITGTNLNGATQVKFGSTAATGVTPVTATELKATSPSGTAASKVDVTVVTSGGTSATGSGDQFTYDAAATQTLTVLKGGTGTGTVTCNGTTTCLNGATFPTGSSVTLAATAAAGSTFVGWSGGGCSGTSNCTVQLNSSTTVTAVFNVSTSSGGGSGGSSGGSGGSGGGSSGSSGGSGSTVGSGGKTEAQKLKEKRKKALAKCKKLHGKAKAQCVKRANQIGKPKKKS